MSKSKSQIKREEAGKEKGMPNPDKYPDPGKEPNPHKEEDTKKQSVDNQKGVAPTADSAGEKYRLTFLQDQKFQGKFYREGEEIEVGEGIHKAYKGRSTLKFEQI